MTSAWCKRAPDNKTFHYVFQNITKSNMPHFLKVFFNKRKKNAIYQLIHLTTSARNIPIWNVMTFQQNLELKTMQKHTVYWFKFISSELWFVFFTHCNEVWCISKQRFKNLEEILGDMPVNKETWTELEKCNSTVAEPKTVPLCKEEQDEPYKMTSSRLRECRFLTKLWETDSMRVAWGPNVL